MMLLHDLKYIQNKLYAIQYKYECRNQGRDIFHGKKIYRHAYRPSNSLHII